MFDRIKKSIVLMAGICLGIVGMHQLAEAGKINLFLCVGAGFCNLCILGYILLLTHLLWETWHE